METLQRTANRGSISTGYDIDNSLKLEADNTERMQRTYANITSAGTPTSTKIATISFWIKRTELQPSGNHLIFIADANFTWVGFSNDRLYILGSTAGINLISTAVFRDTSAWYHIVVAFDTTQSTASNRVKAYVNGEQVTVWGGNENFGTQNNDIDLYDTNTSHYLGWSDAQSQSGYYSEFYLIDGQQLAPTEFGETDSDSGIWKPKAYGGTFGVQGYHLDFEDSSALGDDVSGNGNNFTALYNITVADQATDTPTNNFATLNPLSPSVPTYNTLTEGGTQMNSLGNAWTTVWSSVPLFKGKWYAEFKRTATNNVFIGAGGIDSNLYYFNLNYVGNNGNGTTFSVGLYSSNGDFYSGSGTTGSSYATNDILCLAVDQDNGAIYFRKNNDAWMGDGSNAGNPASGASRTGAQIIDWGTATVLAASIYSSGDTVQANFGGYTSFSNSTSYSDELGMGSFVYEPPASYLAICTKNLAEYG